MSSTRERIIETSAELFRVQGYASTGVKQIVTAAQAPFGSLYHFFPGGEEQLGAEAVRVSGGQSSPGARASIARAWMPRAASAPSAS